MPCIDVIEAEAAMRCMSLQQAALAAPLIVSQIQPSLRVYGPEIVRFSIFGAFSLYVHTRLLKLAIKLPRQPYLQSQQIPFESCSHLRAASVTSPQNW